jgi:nucleoprotein TPR
VQSECKSLQGRLEEANGELLQIRAQHNETLKSFETERTAWINDKKTLEDTIVDMSTSEKHSESDRSSWEEGMRALEERAKVIRNISSIKIFNSYVKTQAAEGRYSNEVVAHAESIKTIEVLRIDLATSQAASRDSLTASETAQAKLLSSETSWKQQKEALDKEVVDLNAR